MIDWRWKSRLLMVFFHELFVANNICFYNLWSFYSEPLLSIECITIIQVKTTGKQERSCNHIRTKVLSAQKILAVYGKTWQNKQVISPIGNFVVFSLVPSLYDFHCSFILSKLNIWSAHWQQTCKGYAGSATDCQAEGVHINTTQCWVNDVQSL